MSESYKKPSVNQAGAYVAEQVPDDFIWCLVGSLSVSDNAQIPSLVPKATVQINRLDAYVQEAPGGGPVTANVKKNGVSIGTVSVAADALSGTVAIAPAVSVTALVDKMTMTIDAVGPTIPGVTLTVYARTANP